MNRVSRAFVRVANQQTISSRGQSKQIVGHVITRVMRRDKEVLLFASFDDAVASEVDAQARSRVWLGDRTEVQVPLGREMFLSMQSRASTYLASGISRVSVRHVTASLRLRFPVIRLPRSMADESEEPIFCCSVFPGLQEFADHLQSGELCRKNQLVMRRFEVK